MATRKQMIAAAKVRVDALRAAHSPILTITAPPPKMERELFLQIGRKRYQVASIREAVSMYTEARDKSGMGASEMPRVQIVDRGGLHLYGIRYNGSVWDIDQHGRSVEVTDF